MFEPWAGTDIYVPAIWGQQFPLANKGYAWHEFFFIKASYPKWTHFIAVARVSMFMWDDSILQNFCWMPEAKWSLTSS